MAVNIYTCIGCGEKLSNDVLVCTKCGRKTLAGKKADFDINEIDCYDYRGDRIRTYDLVLPKHQHAISEPL